MPAPSVLSPPDRNLGDRDFKRGPTTFAVSVVIPFYNEGEGARHLLEELSQVLEKIDKPVEVLLIDDGSADETASRLEEMAESHAGWNVVRQSRNQGQAAALYRGLQMARAPIVITLDGDGQNDPADIPALLLRLEESGADMVAGVRVNRDDSWLRRRMSRVANAVRSRILNDGVRDTGCGLKGFRKEVVDSFLPIRTLYSFMPALAVAAGYSVIEQPVRHRPRLSGVSSYGLGVMLWRPLLDLLGIWWFSGRRFAVRAQDHEPLS